MNKISSCMLVCLALIYACCTGCANKRGGYKESTTSTSDTASIVAVPEFPMPPPQPSATDIIHRSYFSSCRTLGDVNVRLSAALDKCGYDRKSYFHVSSGFALVTQLEKINKDGTIKPENERWVQEEDQYNFSLKNYLKRLLFANPGYYRCIVFVISDKYYNYSKQPATAGQANEWLASGVNRLPADIAKLPFSENHVLDVLIYEFKKNESDTTVNIIIPSPVAGKKQLTSNKIYEGLK